MPYNMHEFEVSISTLGGQSIRVHRSEPSGPTGICHMVHGFGDAQSSFAGVQAFLLEHGYSVVYYDLPGHGENHRLDVSFDETVSLLGQMRQRDLQGYRQSVVIGHSLGGLIALLSLCNSPSSATRCIVIEASVTEPDYEFFRWIQEPPLGVGYDGLVASQRAASEPYSATYRKNLADTSRDVFRSWSKIVYDRFFKYRERILASSIPFTYVYGTQSPGPEWRHALARYSQITVFGLPNASHWVHIDAADAFKAILLRSLSSGGE
jgi:pimeloyl-ACP methyl ester carboxylesterase